jgi:DNA-binding NarL/FixJ family response regulator
VLLVDDHPIVRQGLVQLINVQPDLTVCGEADDVTGALATIGRDRPDLVILDLSLKGRSGMELVKALKAQHARLPVLVLSVYDEQFYAERLLRLGARGYVMKDEAPERLITAIHRVLAGELYVSDRIAAQLVHQAAGGHAAAVDPMIAQLSDRELEVFQLLGQGHGTRPIAEQLHLSVKTIETYRAHIMEKLRLNSATDLIRRAAQWLQLSAR